MCCSSKWTSGPITRDPRFFEILEVDPDKEFVVGMIWSLRRYRRILELSLFLLVGLALRTLYHLTGLALVPLLTLVLIYFFPNVRNA